MDFSSLTSLGSFFQPSVSNALGGAIQTNAPIPMPFTGGSVPALQTSTADSPFSSMLSGLGTAFQDPSVLSMILSLGSAISPDNTWQKRLSESFGGMARGQLLARALGNSPESAFGKRKDVAGGK